MMIWASMAFYQGFLQAVYQQVIKNHTAWDNSWAQGMLTFHSKKLLAIRQNSQSFFELLVGNYVYLRDGTRKNYQDLALLQVVHDRLDAIRTTQHDEEGPTKTPNPRPTCAHCKSREVHNYLSLEHVKLVCPLKTLSSKDARMYQPEFIEQIKQHKNPTAAQLEKILEEVVAKAKAQGKS